MAGTVQRPILDAADAAERARRFQALHARPGTFIIPNPWDAGTARMLTALGFEALTTTSAGLAFSLGRRDNAGAVSRDETLDNAAAILAATALPVAADLENGFAHSPEGAAETIRQAAAIGLSGGSIEDATGDAANPIYDFEHAVERVAAVVETVRQLPHPFIFVARAENFLHGRPDLDDTIRRLQAFERAGADALYAPGLPSIEAIRAVCAAVSRPVNVLAGGGRPRFTLAQLREAGVKRISVGSALNLVALGSFFSAAKRLYDSGDLDFSGAGMSYGDVTAMMPPGRS